MHADSARPERARKRQRTSREIRGLLQEIGVYTHPMRSQQALRELWRTKEHVYDTNATSSLWSTVLHNRAFWKHYGSLRDVGKVASVCQEFAVAVRVSDDLLHGLLEADHSQQPVFWLRAMLMLPSFKANTVIFARASEAIAHALLKHKSARSLSLAKSRSLFYLKGPLVNLQRVKTLERVSFSRWEDVLRHWVGSHHGSSYIRTGKESDLVKFQSRCFFSIRRAKAQKWFPGIVKYPFGNMLLDWYLQRGKLITDAEFRARASRRIREHDNRQLITARLGSADAQRCLDTVLDIMIESNEEDAVSSFVRSATRQTEAPQLVCDLVQRRLHVLQEKAAFFADITDLPLKPGSPLMIPLHFLNRRWVLGQLFHDRADVVFDNHMVRMYIRRLRTQSWFSEIAESCKSMLPDHLHSFVPVAMDFLLIRERTMLSFYAITPLEGLRPAVLWNICYTARQLNNIANIESVHSTKRHLEHLIDKIDQDRNPLRNYLVNPSSLNDDNLNRVCRGQGCFNMHSPFCRGKCCFWHCSCIDCFCCKFGVRFGPRRLQAEMLQRSLRQYGMSLQPTNVALAFIDRRITQASADEVAQEICFREFYHVTTGMPVPKTTAEMEVMNDFRREYTLPRYWPWQDEEEVPPEQECVITAFAGPDFLRTNTFAFNGLKASPAPETAPVMPRFPSDPPMFVAEHTSTVAF